MISYTIQQPLWGRCTPFVGERLFATQRTDLGQGAWVDYLPGWIEGHATLHEDLAESLPWQSEQRTMYDRVVQVPRLLAPLSPENRPALVQQMADRLSAHYQTDLQHVLCAYYRGGRDSVAFHQDKELKDQQQALVAVVTLGGPRRFLLRPVGGGASRRWTVGWGDLMVMGGTCQQYFEHAVPKMRRAEPRIAVMFREAGVSAVERPGSMLASAAS